MFLPHFRFSSLSFIENNKIEKLSKFSSKNSLRLYLKLSVAGCKQTENVYFAESYGCVNASTLNSSFNFQMNNFNL